MATIDPRALQARAEAGHAHSQYLLSQDCYRNGDPEAMVQWLKRAAQQDLPEALDALGFCYDRGLGVEPDRPRAEALYRRAAGHGAAQAAYRLAELLYKTADPGDHAPEICEHLGQAVRADYIPALRAAGFLLCDTPGRHQEGIALLRRAAGRGDAAAGFMLAGLDPGATHRERRQWIRQASAGGFPLTAELEPPAERRPAPATDPEPLRLDPDCLEPERPGDLAWETWNESPMIRVAHNALTLLERAWLVHVAAPFMRRAEVIEPDARDPGAGVPGMQSPVRTSESTFLSTRITDLIVHYIDRKIARITGIEPDRSEPFSILHYRPGQYYKPHVDYFDPSLPSAERLLQNGGQRTASAICYLSTVEAGGGTAFPELGLEVPAQAGSLLFFRNCHPDGRVDRRSLHAGLPVRRGDKWVATKWYREGRTGYLPTEHGPE